MPPLENVIKKAIPPELLTLAGAFGEWFANSGYLEALEENGTTGLTSITTRINGRPAVIVFAASYLTPEQENRILETATETALNAEQEES